jgi:mono/diheme cytochrome c family protein
MKRPLRTSLLRAFVRGFVMLGASVAAAQTGSGGVAAQVETAPNRSGAAEHGSPLPTLAAVRAAGALHSGVLNRAARSVGGEIAQPKLDVFRREVEPILRETCFKCHGAEKQKADFRIDTLDPDLQRGRDVSWWLEISGVLGKGEMPPKDEPELSGEKRAKVMEWLSEEIQVASQVRRSEEAHSSFRRMTRYEYNYALQDLLGLPYDFAADLPRPSY